MNKSNPKYDTIDEYIALFPQDIQQKLKHLRQLFKTEAPTATETISYQMPTLRLNGKNLIHFAAFKNHLGVYPTGSGVEAFKRELGEMATSKGTIAIPYDQEIPDELLRKIVSYRIKATETGY